MTDRPARVHLVTGCINCPLEQDGDGRPYCGADHEQRYTPEGRATRPDWCPLAAGRIVVEAAP